MDCSCVQRDSVRKVIQVDASPETLQRTTFREGAAGDRRVNLETSLRVGSKLGGHFVTGHVDGVGYLESVESSANSWDMTFHISDPQVARYIVPKGSITVNGVSLTVAACSELGDRFTVAVIPLTYVETNLQDLAPGDAVNLEGDVLGKYVEKLLRLATRDQQAALASWQTTFSASPDEISPAFLVEHGYL